MSDNKKNLNKLKPSAYARAMDIAEEDTMRAHIASSDDAPEEGYIKVVVGAVKDRMTFRVLDTSRSKRGDEVWITLSDKVARDLKKQVGDTNRLVEKILFVKFPDGVETPPE